MTDFDTERDPIDVLAEEFAEQFRQGETPSVDEYVERYPQWADQLRELLPSVAQMEQLKRLKDTAGANRREAPRLEQLGDYRILREVGRGGMGIVYEAVQQSLGRHVALKVLPEDALRDPKKLERFRREAQAAANLHHSNIVPVFGVGEQDGLHYYVMQFIQGQGLDRVLAGWRRCQASGTSLATQSGHSWTRHRDREGARTQPQGNGDQGDPISLSVQDVALPAAERWREVARMGTQAAEALHYAHQQGTLHRDVKPANLLLDRHGNLWVADFGLAKLIDQEGLTSTGDILGTLQYMAPETLEGRADTRSDVYSLGLTLYELLTLEPPFRGPDMAALLGAVGRAEVVPPRQLDPTIPRDLETIVLKATACEPTTRYQTAQALAEDLQRFLDDQPIQARRSTPVERLRRWCRRNPAVAMLTAALVLVFFGGFTLVFWKWREAEAESQRAEGNAKLSLQALEEIFDQFARRDAGPFGGPKQGKGPGFPWPQRRFDSEEDVLLLQTILKFYDQFARQNATNARLRREGARSYRRVGDIQRRFGKLDKAEAAYRRAAAMFEELIAASPSSHGDRLEWAETYALLERWPGGARELQAAVDRLQKAVAIALEVGDTPSGRRTALAARAQQRLGSVLPQQDHPVEGEVAFREAVRLWKSLAVEAYRPPMWEVDLCVAYKGLAAFLLHRDRLEDARLVLQESINDLKSWRAGGVDWVRQGLLKEQYQRLAATLTRMGETRQAAEALRQAEQFGKHSPAPKGSPLSKDKRPRF